MYSTDCISNYNTGNKINYQLLNPPSLGKSSLPVFPKLLEKLVCRDNNRLYLDIYVGN